MHEILLSGHFKKMAVPILKRLVEKGTSILNMLKSDFVIEGQEIVLSCPEGIQRWSIVFRCKKGLLPRGKKFTCGDVKEIRLRSLMPLRDLTNIAVRILPGEGFKILYGPLTDYSLYLLEIDFGIENPRLIDNIVSRSVQLESPGEERQEYWMHAQLRFVDVLERFFSNFSIKDLNFNVDVAVHQDIKLAVPPYFKRELEIVVKWLESRDRELKRRLSVEHMRVVRKRKAKGKRLLEILRKMQKLFSSRVFRNFVDVRRDFRYYDCLRGTDYYSLPFPTWPKFMTVISRTNLDLRKPAAVGILEYKRKDFRKAVEKIFGY